MRAYRRPRIGRGHAIRSLPQVRHLSNEDPLKAVPIARNALQTGALKTESIPKLTLLKMEGLSLMSRHSAIADPPMARFPALSPLPLAQDAHACAYDSVQLPLRP